MSDVDLWKDTHSRCGGDGCNRANRDGLLGITQVSGTVGARHDTCEWSGMKCFILVLETVVEVVHVNKSCCTPLKPKRYAKRPPPQHSTLIVD